MDLMLGNMSFKEIMNDESRAKELEDKLELLGYKREANCKENDNTDRKTFHIYDIPRRIVFSVITNDVIEILKSYSDCFIGRVGIYANDLRKRIAKGE